MEKRVMVAMLMESPFYFDLRLRDRLVLVQQHHRRFSTSSDAGPPSLRLRAGAARAGSCRTAAEPVVYRLVPTALTKMELE